MNKILIYLFFISVITSTSCTILDLLKNHSSDEKITEVSISSHNGLGGIGTKIFFKSEGNAEITCSYKGDTADWQPFSSNGLCEKLFLQENKHFEKTPNDTVFSREDTYFGKITAEDFERISDIILKNNFFSMKDEYSDGQILTDSPPVITSVVSSKQSKKVVNYRSHGGQKLLEIEQSIFETAAKIKWTK